MPKAEIATGPLPVPSNEPSSTRRRRRPIRPTLSPPVVGRALWCARGMGVFEFALLAWSYEQARRASEVGQDLVSNVDLEQKLVRPIHLKGGRAPEPLPMLDACAEALPPWLEVRQQWITRPEMEPFLFPTRGCGHCYACQGTGHSSLRGRKRSPSGAVLGRPKRRPCERCQGKGKTWGVSRWEVYSTIKLILTAAGATYTWPHCLRHSLAAHLYAAGIDPLAIQERLAHRSLATTLRYGSATPQAREKVRAALTETYEAFRASPTK